ncbi:MAG: hypothetical protein U0519_05150 [Candidatus Gracilibacteria bacterium]
MQQQEQIPQDTSEELLSQESKKILVLPLFGHPQEEQIRILIQTDGNNRAKGVNQGYDDGGKNVIHIAEYLAQRGDVSTMVACIMSADNAEKRGDEFFWKMYQAFAALGTRIEMKGTLKDKQIRMETYGDLEKLKQRGGTAKQFAEMVETVCAKTHDVANPKLTLRLGINYDENIALENEVSIMYRSGMEDRDAVRLSGMRSHESIQNFGSQTLWPNVTTGEIDEVIEATKKSMHPQFGIGYPPEMIAGILQSVTTNHQKPATTTVTVPYAGSATDTLTALTNLYSTDTVTHSSVLVEPNGKTTKTFGKTTPLNFRFVHGGTFQLHPENTEYEAIIAAGQDARPGVTIPTNIEPKYATVHKSGSTPAGIAAGVQKAIDFMTSNVKLKGAERQISAVQKNTKREEEITFYRNLLASDTSLDEQVKAASMATEITEQEKAYNTAADIFTAEMLDWGSSIGIPAKSDPQWRAVINYALTSFFLTCYPNHRAWKTLQKDWEESAEWLAKYMLVVYQTDEEIFDEEIPGETLEAKKLRLRNYRDAYFAGMGESTEDSEVNTKTADTAQNPNYKKIKNITKEWKKFLDEFAGKAHPEIVKLWRQEMLKFADASVAEWESSSLEHPERSLIHAGPEEREKLGKWGRMEVSPYVGKRLESLLANYDNASALEKQTTEAELDLWNYLNTIEASMGAGQAYLTIALTLPAEQMTPESLDAIRDICILSNCYFRILNDISGRLKRSHADQETKPDSVTILSRHFEHHFAPNDSFIKALAYLKKVSDDIEAALPRAVRKLAETCPKLAIAVQRAIIAKDIYSDEINGGGHYRTRTRDDMAQIFSTRFSVGF